MKKRLTIAEFNALTSRQKWDRWETIGKGRWICPKCRAVMQDGPRHASPMSGCSVHCKNCDRMLTCRTGGGQNDPFLWELEAKNAKQDIPGTVD